ncbi:hypothetical protein KM043_014802 [Ampulex compressa]|nr:hypothetical protein KM043_014802 [Ampulex compressa]
MMERLIVEVRGFCGCVVVKVYNASLGGQRQGRASLQAELPSSKAKREQALRNILAARRRQVLSQRPFEFSRSRTPRPGEETSKDSSDILEAQETRHGSYVTSSTNSKTEASIDEDSQERQAENFEKKDENSTTRETTLLQDSEPKIEISLVERAPSKSSVETSFIEDTRSSSGSSRIQAVLQRNASATSSSSKPTDAEARKKNTVSMPESLYNHFRPVESNIPVEDMSQFLYFGQKLQPEQNQAGGNTSSDNNTLESSSTIATTSNTRRRYSTKRHSSTTTTTTTTVASKLEEILDDEMNVAVVDKGKVSKTKNPFRGQYYRKSRPSDATIASNVIPTKDADGNSTRIEGVASSDDENPSAHASEQDQLRGGSERGSAAHVLDETRNATESTQIPRVSASAEEESEIGAASRGAYAGKKAVERRNGVVDVEGRVLSKSGGASMVDGVVSKARVRGLETKLLKEATMKEFSRSMDVEMHAEHSEQRLRRVNVYEMTSNSSAGSEVGASRSKESNNIEARIEEFGETTTESSSSSRMTSLRIVVTEENFPRGFPSEERNVVKIVEGAEKVKPRFGEVSTSEVTMSDALGSVEHEQGVGSRSNASLESDSIGAFTSSTKFPMEEYVNKTYLEKGPRYLNDARVKVDSSNVSSMEYLIKTLGVDATKERKVYSSNDSDVPSRSINASVTSLATRSAHHKQRALSLNDSNPLPKPSTKPSKEEARHPFDTSNTSNPSATLTARPNSTHLKQRASSKDDQNPPPTPKSPKEDTSRTRPINPFNDQNVSSSTPLPSRSPSTHHKRLSQDDPDPPSKPSPRSSKQDADSRPIQNPIDTAPTAPLSPSSIHHPSTPPKASNPPPAPVAPQASIVAHQQQHVYAYTITNVTRLLRNYTGPGLSGEERGGPRLSTGTGEITTGSAQPPPTPALPRAAIGSARAPEELSAGTTVEAAGGGAGTSVGERHRKPPVAHQPPQRAPPARSPHQRLAATSNDQQASIRQARPQESTTRGTLRWIHSRSQEASSERRLLRKSASAVLNQRIGEERVASSKRRRPSTGRRTRLEASGGRAPPGRNLVGVAEEEEAARDVGGSFGVNREGTMGQAKARSILAPQRAPEEAGEEESPKDAPGERKEPETGEGASTVTVTVGEGQGETATSQQPAPVFPVTPRIIAETFTFASKAPEGERPFGMAEDLDPSEIQKMYRAASNGSSTEATVLEESTTLSSTTARSFDGEDRPESSTISSTIVDTAIASSTSQPQRSPEVRPRNLSDKSKDKDDVLPIMQLYNTSDIFNGSEAEGSRGGQVAASTEAEPSTTSESNRRPASTSSRPATLKESAKKDKEEAQEPVRSSSPGNRTRHRPPYHQDHSGSAHRAANRTFLEAGGNASFFDERANRTFFDAGLISVSPRASVNISEVISKRHDGDAIASQETVAVVSYILATLVVFPIAVGVGLILRRLILRNRKVLEESDTSSEISCRKDALNLENGDFKTSIEKAITKLPRIQHLCHEAEKPPPPPTQESRWEFPRDKLRLQTVLGQGNFGQVWKAEADDLTGHQGTTRLVAVKTVKEGASDREKEDLVRELEIMQQLGSHPNVVTLLGCCTEEEPHYLILEYVMYGKLLAYLRDHRTRQDFYNFSEDSAALTSRDLTVFGYCVARGMEYLASKKIIHRDLAARNVLVDHNKLCKIADFGMSRFANEEGEVIETRHGRNALPIRWMAPESLIYSLFTTKTDVWSFGILMWEIVTLGSTPYPDMTAREVMRNVQNGYRLERPSHCRSELFRVISRCWHADPDRRPEFQTLRRDLAQLLEDNMNGHYVDLESFASECTD